MSESMTDLSDAKIITACHEVGEWADENFGTEQPAYFPLLGVAEESGELTTSVLKRAQGIDDAEKYQETTGDEAEMDAIGDIFIYLMDFIHRSEIDIEDVVDEIDRRGEVSYQMEQAAIDVGITPVTIYVLFGFYGQYASVIDCYIMNRKTIERETAGIIEFLTIMCDICGYPINEVVDSTMDEVLDREWDADVSL